jgi:cbb3-type cytochrome oxidase subunit 3
MTSVIGITMLLAFFFAFILIIYMVYGRATKASMDEHARIPLNEDDKNGQP